MHSNNYYYIILCYSSTDIRMSPRYERFTKNTWSCLKMYQRNQLDQSNEISLVLIQLYIKNSSRPYLCSSLQTKKENFTIIICIMHGVCTINLIAQRTHKSCAKSSTISRYKFSILFSSANISSSLNEKISEYE